MTTAQRDGWTPVRAGAGIIQYGRGAAPPRSAVIRYARRHIGFLAGLLLAAVALGIAYRYAFDPLDERTLPHYIRSCLHAIGLACSGWAVHLAFATGSARSRLGGALRRLPLAAEFIIKALAMTAVLTIVAVGLRIRPLPHTPAGTLVC